ncbi:gem-associated protein 5-like [Homarus americanus]|uniref:gem-associated protein 5-like n=1 Tax=Homarus americanus TaxID=6706 RepID=UPI001C486F11|nr:gem-associated protein 5-like [Homarus americanus]
MDKFEDKDHYWERTEFLNFGKLPISQCSDDDIKLELGDILLPPSPNWFISDAVDSRSEDGLLVTAAFKTIVVYHMVEEKRLPKVVKVIPLSDKVLSVRLHRQVSEPDYGHTVASITDSSSVRLYNLHTGSIIAQHLEHQNLLVNALCWGSIGGEEVVVTVGNSGRVVVWQARHGVTRVHTLHQFSELSSVEINPNEPSQALIAASKDIVLVSLKDGKVLTQLHGHDYVIYCMKWYVGEGSPLSPDSAPTNSRAEALKESSNTVSDQGEGKNKKGPRNKSQQSNKTSAASNGPFIVSSDYGRNIFLWDLSAKRYICKTNIPQSTSGFRKQTSNKEKNPGKQHIALAWYKGNLLSSNVRGELLQWTLWSGGSKFKVIHHLHNRVIYNLEVIGDMAVTYGQDRLLHGFHIGNSTHMFQLPTLGACASSLSFCPQDVNRLAIGSQENNIRLLNFASDIPLSTQTVWQNIKGKVFSLSWHPAHDGRLLFGTGLGQVGWTDVSSGRVTAFAYYHQKPVYKVEWGPLVCPGESEMSDTWCAYSFGDREIAIRASSDPMADPVFLHTLIPESDPRKIPKDITEFSFSPDYKYLSIGSQDGQVRVYRSCDLELMTKLVVVRKSIQHLLWQPPSDSTPSYILAVGSSENKVYIFHLEELLNNGEIGSTITQASQELCGHESRVVWLAWSPHELGVLATASYDHTVQLWDTKTGEPMVNYGGHLTRVFRVEFSPADSDLLYSFAEENFVHVWRPSQLTCKTPGESTATLKEYRPRKVKETEVAGATEKETEKSQEESTKGEKKAASTGNSSGPEISVITSSASSKKVVSKSFFPKLHSVCSRKKSFHQISILNLLAQTKGVKSDLHKVKADQEQEEEDLEEDLGEESDAVEGDGGNVLPNIVETSEKYSFLLEKESEMASPEDFAYALNLYGNPHQMDCLMATEIDNHNGLGNIMQAGQMHCWRGSLDDHIRSAARHKKLNPFLVASAPQVSMKLWELACEAYAEQLVDEGDVITGVSYLVNISKVEQAVNILLEHRHYREALAITKCRLSYNEEILEKVVTKWAFSAVFEGNFDLAALLQLSIGRVEDAARTMARRSDPGSLFVSAKLYEHTGNEDLANSVGLLALKEASLRHDQLKIKSFLSHLPKLNWFQAVSCCHSVIRELLQQVSVEKEVYNCYLMRSIRKQKNLDDQEGQGEMNIVNGIVNSEDDHIHENEDMKLEVIAPPLWIPLLERIMEEWTAHGITQEQYPQLYETVTHNLSTQQMPTSVKQLWFLVSVALSKCLMNTCQKLGTNISPLH